ncbi:MAG TPA: ATP-binding protein, partial [Ilumatobacteraceae bacterium]|nr:ATP-binding protein [Ilumatobacteraceae bacterium]
LSEREAVDDGAVATMDREEAIGNWLDDRAVADAWNLAPQFASVGADRDWFDECETVSGPDTLGPALQWISSTIQATSLLSELTDTTNRISNLVEAVKSYSQMDRSAMQHIDIHDGIESTLVMLAPKLAKVDVQRDFGGDVPAIDAYAAELNQVWTNLIDNAIDAMDGHGTLRLSTHLDGGCIFVDIGDSGHGMPSAVQDRAFEPFFTTKDVGKGTGLGLDISRRIIVDRHGGEITFDSVPGETIAHVRLPVAR